MIFSLFILGLHLTHLDLIFAAGTFDPNTVDGLEYLVQETDDDIRYNSSSDPSSGCKRSRIETSTTNKKLRNIQMKYRSQIVPIDPKIDDNMADYLKKWEKNLLSKGKYCVWENFNNISSEDAKRLCIKAWTVQGQLLPEIEKNDNMIPDCDHALIGGPSEHECNFRNYKGYYQYLDEVDDKEFLPDLLRCNCVYQNRPKGKKSYKTVPKSKRFFFILRHPDEIYYILTILGPVNSRKVKIVNVIPEEIIR